MLVVAADEPTRARAAAIAQTHQLELRTVARGADVPPAVGDCDAVCLDAGALAQLVDATAAVAAGSAVAAALRISALGGGAMALSGVARSAAAAFGAAGAALWEGDVASAAIHGVSPDDEPLVRRLGELAIAARVQVCASGTPARALLAAPIAKRDRVRLGGICLIDPPGRRRGAEDAAALRGLGERLAAELAFVSAHYRLVAEHEVLRESALLDPITGLWSRAGLEPLAVAAIAAARRRSEPISVVLVDVHQLRMINERHGHIAGDAVLAHVARAVRARVRASDLVGRAGADEIAAILPQTTGDQALAVVEELTGCAGGAIALPGGGGALITLTGGAAQVGDGEHGLEQALARAAAALGRARAGGGSSAMAEAVGTGVDGESGVLHIGPGLANGKTLGGMYQIRHELSRGAMGIVYRGDDLGLNRPVAIKVLRSDLAENQDLLERFRAEAAMLASLHHPNLVQVFAFGTEGEDVYFVMELVEGEALAEVMTRVAEAGEHIDPEAVEKIVLEIADAVDAMHAVGLIHRDVKPANILLDRIRDRAVLVDVGVAKRREERGDAAGTPGFAAPESFTDEHETPATDVYGLAATAYMMLTGRAPFGSGEVLQVLERQMTRPPIKPSALRPELNDAVDSVLLKALAPAQLDRYSSAAAFAIGMRSALRRVAQERSAAAPAASPVADAAPVPGGLTLERPRREAQQRMVRGVIFRVATKVLGHHLGAGWLAQTAAQDPALAEVLRADLPAFGWQPVDRLVELLARLDKHESGAKLARSIGRGTASATFARFFGGDPRALSPGALLGAAPVYWPRYHGWGSIEVTVDDVDCKVLVSGDPGHPLICQVVAGTLSRIAELAGGQRVTAQHPECVRTGAKQCLYQIRWQKNAGGPSTAR